MKGAVSPPIQRGHQRAPSLSELAAGPLPLPAGVELRWLGVAGYRLSYEDHALYIDPHVTRVPFRAMLSKRPAVADVALQDRMFGAERAHVTGILVGHTHFDHAIDVPALTRRWNTTAYGSRSLKRLMSLYGLGDNAVEVTTQKEYELGPFAVTFFPSLHSKLLLGYKVPADGEFSCEHLDGLTTNQYRCGDIYGVRIRVGGVSFYHQGNANLIDDLLPRAASTSAWRGSRGEASRPTTGRASCHCSSRTSSSRATSTVSSALGMLPSASP
jgi:L-ascorbate metabolism protein UlaG (beta-lactamase superfamily)